MQLSKSKYSCALQVLDHFFFQHARRWIIQKHSRLKYKGATAQHEQIDIYTVSCNWKVTKFLFVEIVSWVVSKKMLRVFVMLALHQKSFQTISVLQMNFYKL